MPFIRYHLPVLSKLPIPWHWHIVEGIANLTHDTGWSKPLGGGIQPWMHRQGLSTDGTTQYLDSIQGSQVTIYRKPGTLWDGKLEMVNAPLVNIKEPSLLWEIDADELWTVAQIQDVSDLFAMNPERQAALYRCLFFVGPDLLLQNREMYGNHSKQEWKRTWRFQPGDKWESHEPPRLMRGDRDVAEIQAFNQDETELHGLVFQHLAYVLPAQLRFKEAYYGYRNALKCWERLQKHDLFPARLADFFPWVKDEATVIHASSLGIKPLTVW